MMILGIESTCDETGVGIVRDGHEVLASVVATSAKMHEKYGGIVPEVAAREQVRVIIPTIEEALCEASCKVSDLDAIAVAYGPGLVGSLLVGVETAKALALAWNKPLIAVNHLVGHVYANWLEAEVPEVSKVANVSKESKVIIGPEFPLVALIVSGGHTDLIFMKNHKHIKWLGGTRDDAAGEVFDKVARILGLKYPGGPQVEKIASQTQSAKLSFKFPRPMIKSADFDFSFAGLKTAVVNTVSALQLTDDRKAEIASEFQDAMVEVLVTKTIKAANKFRAKSVIVGGGVAANTKLRDELQKKVKDIKIYFPDKSMSVDNGAMVAGAAFYMRNFVDPISLQADPGLYF